MTVELHDQATADVEAFVIAWLTPLGPVDIVRRSGDPLPFRLVRRVTGADDENLFYDTAVVSVHTLSSGEDAAAAATEADRTHRRMLLLTRDLGDVTLNGETVSVDYAEVVENPIWVDYSTNQVLRKVGRYRISLRFSDV